MSVLYFLIVYLSHGYQLREKYAKQYVPGNDVQKSAQHWSVCLSISLPVSSLLEYTGCFNTLAPPSAAKLGNGTYANYIFSEPYINSRLPCKFSEL